MPYLPYTLVLPFGRNDRESACVRYVGPMAFRFEVSGTTVKTLSSMLVIVPFKMHSVVLARLYCRSKTPPIRMQIRITKTAVSVFFLLM